MLRSLVGMLVLLLLGLAAVGVTFSASSAGRAAFRFVNGTEPKTLDPGLMTGEPEGRIADAIFEGLTRLDARSLEPVPGVAERWEIAPDGKRYTFHLRKTARWSDGRPVTAHDFAYAWRRLQDPKLGAEYAYILHMVRYAAEYNTYGASADALKGPIATGFRELARAHPRGIPASELQKLATRVNLHAALKGAEEPLLRDLPARTTDIEAGEVPALVRALEREAERRRARFREAERRFGRDAGVYAKDDHTLVVELVAPTPYFLELTAFYPSFPVPRWVVEKEGLAGKWFLPETIVSNGAFRLAAWRVGDRIRLERSETYWDAANVALGSVDALPIENMTTALNLYLSGEVDWLPSGYYPLDLADEIKKRDDFYTGPALIIYYYRINTTRKPFDDARVRKALNLAIDRELITREVLGLGQIPARHFVPPGLPGYTPPESAIRYDVAEARRLLAEAGFPGGRGFPKFGILYNTLEMHKKLAEVLADQLRRNLGLDVTAYNQEWQSYQATMRALDYDLGRAGWIGDYEDPNTFLDIWVTNGGNNQTGWGNPLYDRLITSAQNMDRFLADPEPLLGALARPEPVRRLLEAVQNAPEGDARLEAMATLRLALLAEAERLLVGEALPVVPLYFYVINGLVKPEVEGFYTELETADGRKRANLRDMHPLRSIRVRRGERAPGASDGP